jgi:hypothetical protein
MKPRFYSNIYWHFTGGPVSRDGSIVWHRFRCLQEVKENTQLRSPSEAMENLKNILNMKMLKATCTELISDNLETEPFCCVSDIPLEDLTFHRNYYGDYAIGFNSRKIHEHFHPVLYFEPHITKIIKKTKTNDMDDKHIETESKLLNILGIHKGNPLVNFLKLTHFDSDYEDSFYGEREWRCLDDYEFNAADVEAVIVPKEEVNDIHHYLMNEGYQNISVLSWDLIENI